MMKFRYFPILAVILLWLSCAPQVLAEEPGSTLPLIFTALEIEADEDSGRTACLWVLENPTDVPWSGELPLPFLSAGFRKESLTVSASAPCRATDSGTLRCGIPPRGSLAVRYEYRTETSLVHARVIALDLTAAPFSSFSEIGRLTVSLTLREEDLPLVKKLAPLNWSLDGQTVRWEFTDLKPDELLPRLFLEKTTWRGLRGSRDFDPNEVQLFVLEHIGDWFRDGIPLPEHPGDYYRVINLLTENEAKDENDEGWWSRRSDLSENTPDILRAADHLILREIFRGHITGTDADSLLQMLVDPTQLNPLTAELLRRHLYGDRLYRVVIGCGMDASLENTQVYHGWMDNLTSADARKYVRIPSGFSYYKHRPESLITRWTELPYSDSRTPGVLRDYLDAVEADLYAEQFLADDRDGRFPLYHYTAPDFTMDRYYNSYYGLIPGGSLSKEAVDSVLEALIEDGHYYSDSTLCTVPWDDPVLAGIGIPCLVQFSSLVILQQLEPEPGPDTEYKPFCWHLSGYLDAPCGLDLYLELLESPALAADRAARLEKQAEREEILRTRIEAAAGQTLLPAPLLHPLLPQAAPRFAAWLAQGGARSGEAAPCRAFALAENAGPAPLSH